MNISVEISMYPLTTNYESPILQFIEKVNQHPDIKVMTNTRVPKFLENTK